MKNLFSVLMAFFAIACIQAQGIGIGTVLPDSSSLLEIKSTSKGFLLPRITDTSLVTKPVEGLFIYNKNAKTPFFFDGAKWQGLSKTLSPLAFGDSLTYTIIGIGTSTELPATTMNQAVSAPISAGNAITFSKKLDENTVALHQAIFTQAAITSIEFKFYQTGASTPTVSIRIRNVKLVSNSYGIGNGQNGGLTDEVFTCISDIYGFKDWIRNQSFGYNFLTASLTTY